MANLQKKIKKANRLDVLFDNVLISILKNVYHSSETSITGEAEIIHSNEIVGFVNYDVTQKIIFGQKSSYFYAPESDEFKFILNSANITFIYGETGNELPNVKEFINKKLFNYEQKQLTF